MINKIIHDLLFGKIIFTAKDGFRNMFFSLCRDYKISLSELSDKEGVLIFSVTQRDIAAVIKAAEKSAMTIEIIKRYGLPHLFYRYRKRLGIPIGCFVFMVIIRLLTLMIWSVEIIGNERISTEELNKILAVNGVVQGVFSDSIQSNDIEFILYNEFEELSWVKVYITGSRVFVEVRERDMEMPSEDNNQYSNIIASKDGEIVRADIFSGEGKIYPGTAVVKGDMLVNGVITFSDLSVKFVNSDAEVFARTKNHVSAGAGLTITASIPVDISYGMSLYFFGLTFPDVKNDKENYFTIDRKYFESADVVFPIGYMIKNQLFFSKGQIELSPAQAALLAFSDFSKASFEIYKNTEVLDRNISMDFSSEVRIKAEYQCVEDIALEQKFTVNEET